MATSFEKAVRRVTVDPFDGGGKRDRRQMVVTLKRTREGDDRAEDVIAIRFKGSPQHTERVITVNAVLWHIIRSQAIQRQLAKARDKKAKLAERRARRQIK